MQVNDSYKMKLTLLPYLHTGRAIFLKERLKSVMAVYGKIKSKKGQSLVETALILPFVILILMGIIDFGMMFNNYLLVSNASREGARNAAVGTSDSDIGLLVSNITQTLDQTRVTVNISPDQILRKKGDEVTVTVTFNYELITPVIGAVVPSPIVLTSTLR